MQAFGRSVYVCAVCVHVICALTPPSAWDELYPQEGTPDKGRKEIKSRGQSQKSDFERQKKDRGDFAFADVCEITAEKLGFTPNGVWKT